MTHRLKALAGTLLLLMMMTVSVSTAKAGPHDQDLPSPLGYVSDFAHLLDEEWYKLVRSVCQDLETTSDVEMLVVTLPTISPMTHAQEYASRLYEAWRVGTAQQERGILLLVAVQERQAAVAVGNTLLGVLTPQKLEEISQKFLRPMFRSGEEYGVNVYRSAVSLAMEAREAPRQKEAQKPKRTIGFWMNLGAICLMVYALWRFTRPDRRHPFPRWKKGEYWGTGQGGFGGNFGGFGGGTGGQGLR
jgi:uncharacterized protein